MQPAELAQTVAVRKLAHAASRDPAWPSVLTATALPMPAPVAADCPTLPMPAAHKVNAATVLRNGHSKRSRRRAVSKLRAKLMKDNQP